MTLWTDDNTDGLFTCDLIQSYMRLTKGPQRGQLVKLRMWQGDLICDILRLDENFERIHACYLCLLPRKNSKSLLGAGLALDGLLDEPGAEIYSCAADRDQAKLVFGEVKQAVLMSPELDAKQGGIFKVYRDVIEYPATGSIYKALSAEAFTKEGLNPSRVIFDELHAQPNWELWNVMNQGSDTRERPLVVAISTFGVMTDTTGATSVCKAQYDVAKQIMAGERVDPNYGARIYETNDRVRGFKYDDPKYWVTANPALGDFLHVTKMRATCARMPENDFKTKRQNIWTSAAKVWLPDGAFDRAEDKTRSIEDHADVVLAFDGSRNGDSTGLLVISVEARPHADVEGLWERPTDKEQARRWKVNRQEVKDTIRAACRRWNVLEIAWDEYLWLDAAEELEDEGLPVQIFPQTPAAMIPATQRVYEDLVYDDPGRPTGFTHSGHEGLKRHIRNTATKTDARGTRVVKEAPDSPNKIDLTVCLIMGRERAAWHLLNGIGPNIH